MTKPTADLPGITPLDPVTRAALALHSRPGSVAVLLGAGISKPTGIRSAWEILDDLIRKVAATHRAEPQDAFDWWHEKFGVNAGYSDVLEQLAPTRYERQALLAPFFDRTRDDLEQERKLPSVAHREIARLMAKGYVRVVITLNFDHLMEEALRDEGIEPTVISGAAAIGDMEPLHLQRHAVIHLHGEYRSPELLNTVTDLVGGYSAEHEALVSQIAREYGLLIVGWSAQWDERLLELLKPPTNPRWPTWWVEPGDLNDAQKSLVVHRRAELVPASADQALSRLSAAVDAVEFSSTRSNPLGTAEGIATIKRERRSGGLAIQAHDLLRQAMENIADSPVIRPADFNEPMGPDTVETVLDHLRPAVAYVAALAYWGDGTTDRWWFGDLERLGPRPHVSGYVIRIGLSRLPSLALAYAAGSAAVASERWDLVRRVLSEPHVEDDRGAERGPLLKMLQPGNCGLSGESRPLARIVINALQTHLGLGLRFAVDAWERFEYLCLLTNASSGGLAWKPWMRVEGLGPAYGKSTAAVWFEERPWLLGELLPHLEGVQASATQAMVEVAFKRHAEFEDNGLLSGGPGFMPSSRHHPGNNEEVLA